MTDAPKLSRDAVARLSDRLRDEAERLARSLLPGGSSARGLYRAARRSEGGPGDSLTVYLQGPKKGKWRHFGGAINGVEHGDMLDLVMATQQLGKEDARAWALRWLGLAPGAVEYRRSPAEEASARKAAAEVRRIEMEKLARRRKSDKTMWLTCERVSLDNAAGQYLAARIPGFPKLLELGWGLNALRFHPALEHPYANGREFPAMLAVVQFPNGKLAALHRYYLTPLPEGGWDVLRKGRDGLDGKLASCLIEGGFVPVWRGCRSDPATGVVREGWSWSDERAGPEVVVCEGVEDALSLAAVKPDRRYAAALSLPNFMQIKLPDWARRVVWFADDDGANEQTPKLMERALERLEEQDREVAIARPPPGFKDANAALRGKDLPHDADTQQPDHPAP